MGSNTDVYGPFRSERTYELTGFSQGEIRDVGEVIEDVDDFLDENTYEDLVEIYGEDELEGINPEYRLEISDGVGCTEIWEKMSERRNEG